MAQLAVEMTGDEARLWKSFQKIVDQQNKLQGGLDRTSRKGKRAGKSLGDAFGEQRKRDLANLVIGFGSVTTALGVVRKAAALVTDELRLHVQLQDKAAAAQVSLHAARAETIKNLPLAGRDEIKGILADLRSISQATSVDERFVAAGMAQALSASGGNVPLSRAAVGLAAQYHATVPEAIGRYAGAILDIGKVTGSQDPFVNQGMMAWVAGRSRVVNPRMQARMPTTLTSMVGLGAGARESAALFAALSVGGADVEGQISGTAAIKLVRQLRDFRRGPEWQERGLAGQIGALHQEPRLARRFLGTASFEEKMRGVVEQFLLAPQSEVAGEFAKNLAELPDRAGLARVGRQSIANLRIDRLSEVDETRRIWAVTEQQLLTRDELAGIGAETRKGLRAILEASGMGALATRVAGLQWEAGTRLGTRGALDEAQVLLEGRLQGLERPMVNYGGWGGGGIGAHGPLEPVYRAPSEAEREMAATLRELLLKLDGVEARLAEGNDDRKQVKANTEAGPELTGANEPGVQ